MGNDLGRAVRSTTHRVVATAQGTPTIEQRVQGATRETRMAYAN